MTEGSCRFYLTFSRESVSIMSLFTFFHRFSVTPITTLQSELNTYIFFDLVLSRCLKKTGQQRVKINTVRLKIFETFVRFNPVIGWPVVP